MSSHNHFLFGGAIIFHGLLEADRDLFLFVIGGQLRPFSFHGRFSLAPEKRLAAHNDSQRIAANGDLETRSTAAGVFVLNDSCGCPGL